MCNTCNTCVMCLCLCVGVVQQIADSSGSTLTAGEGGSDIISVATPSLVASISQLLRNLVVLAPADTFTCLKRDSFVQILMK